MFITLTNLSRSLLIHRLYVVVARMVCGNLLLFSWLRSVSKSVAVHQRAHPACCMMKHKLIKKKAKVKLVVVTIITMHSFNKNTQMVKCDSVTRSV